MSDISPTRRRQVEQRAGLRCEYCHVSVTGQIATFPIDHIVPRSKEGKSDLDNIALACTHCNTGKSDQTTGYDSVSSADVSLFHPRLQEWDQHFEWSVSQPELILGRTPCGRATIEALKMNHPLMLQVRDCLIRIGLLNLPAG